MFQALSRLVRRCRPGATGYKYVALNFYPVSKVHALQDRLDGIARAAIVEAEEFIRPSNVPNKSWCKGKDNQRGAGGCGVIG